MINKLSVGTAQFGFGYGINHKNLQVSQPMINQILNFCSKNNIKLYKSIALHEQKTSNINKMNLNLKNLSSELGIFLIENEN